MMIVVGGGHKMEAAHPQHVWEPNPIVNNEYRFNWTDVLNLR